MKTSGRAPDKRECISVPRLPINRRGVAERHVGLAKQRTRRLLLASNLPEIYWSYAMSFAAEMFRNKALRRP